MSELGTTFRDEVRSLGHDVEAALRKLRHGSSAGQEIPTLSQEDSQAEARERQLASARESFEFSYDFAPPLPNVKGLPKGQEFTPEYLLEFVPTVADILKNQVEALDTFFDEHPHLRPDLSQIPRLIETWASGPSSFLNSAIFTETTQVLLKGRVAREREVGEFQSLYKALPAPPIVQAYGSDWTFGYMRVGGFNPTLLRRVEKLPDNFPVSDAQLAQVAGEGETLDSAGRSGRLYLCDYGILEGVPAGVVHGVQKYPTAPLALFCWVPGGLEGGSLMPVAIQLGQVPSKDTPVFTPRDGVRWTIAKAFVQSADGDHHQAVAHLFRTHLRVEPVVVATVRELAANHPVHVLLAPHFAFTLAINNDARNELLAPGGVVDMLLGPTIEGSKQVIQRACAEWRFDETSPEAEFRKRGVDDPALLPTYPYRDDTLLLWKAIRGFVDSYVDLYYRNEQDLAADRELQAWAQCLISEDGARFAGMSIRPGETFADLAYLKQVCAQILYMASAQHAAVNYAQYPLMSYAPNCPLAVYGPAPTASSFENDATYVRRLPEVSMCLWQLAVADLLSSRQPTKLLHYSSGTFTDPRVESLIRQAQDELTRTEATIVQRNNERRFPYPFQLPSKVPNSILI